MHPLATDFWGRLFFDALATSRLVRLVHAPCTLALSLLPYLFSCSLLPLWACSLVAALAQWQPCQTVRVVRYWALIPTAPPLPTPRYWGSIPLAPGIGPQYRPATTLGIGFSFHFYRRYTLPSLCLPLPCTSPYVALLRHRVIAPLPDNIGDDPTASADATSLHSLRSLLVLYTSPYLLSGLQSSNIHRYRFVLLSVAAPVNPLYFCPSSLLSSLKPPLQCLQTTHMPPTSPCCCSGCGRLRISNAALRCAQPHTASAVRGRVFVPRRRIPVYLLSLTTPGEIPCRTIKPAI
jgi:hypothetical protein